MKNFNIIEIRTNSVKVSDNNGTLLVAKYQDNNGEYILNGDLEKQYISTPVVTPTKKKVVRESNTTAFNFVVEYARPHFNSGTTYKTIYAKTYEIAERKLFKMFKTIYEYSTY